MSQETTPEIREELAIEDLRCTRCLSLGIFEPTIFAGARYYVLSTATAGRIRACADCWARLEEQCS